MPALQRTFSIIKPDAVVRGLTEEIQARLQAEGLSIVAQKAVQLTREQAESFYAEHKERPFFDSLVEFMTSSTVVIQILEGVDAIARNREVMGATNPADASEGTLRADYGESLDRNSVHGSDSPPSAEREIEMFFPGESVAQSA